jgi:hypothetical protein
MAGLKSCVPTPRRLRNQRSPISTPAIVGAGNAVGNSIPALCILKVWPGLEWADATVQDDSDLEFLDADDDGDIDEN